MKKFVFIALLFLGGIAAHAQTPVTATHMNNPNGLTLDTASQAAAEGPTLIVKGYAKTVSIEVVTTKISGTVAGTIAIQVSNDGVHYATLGSIITLVDATGVTSYTYKEVDKGFLYYKALITQTGTSSLSYAAYLYTQAPLH